MVNVKINGSNRKAKNYPKLMINGSVIVLFKKEKTGVVIYGDSDLDCGNYSENWDMDLFCDFHGDINIRNE